MRPGRCRPAGAARPVPPGPVPPAKAEASPAGVSRAQQILDERLASGEITPELYRDLKQALGD